MNPNYTNLTKEEPNDKNSDEYGWIEIPDD
jgi:hypothetical protein